MSDRVKHETIATPAARWALITAAGALLAVGCSLNPEANPGYCESDSDCGSGLVCVRFANRDDGLCVGTPSMDAGGCVQGASCYAGPDNTLGVGACAAGMLDCSGGGAGVCMGQVVPAASDDTCDGIDSDCDGTADENVAAMGECTVAQPGVCSAGRTSCVNGALRCSPTTSPRAETCDSLDNDCDEIVDEDAGDQCFTGAAGCTAGADGSYDCLGVCQPGQSECVGGEVGGACIGEVPAGEEVCTPTGQTALDEDCDGAVDEMCPCSDAAPPQTCFTGTPSSAGVGACTTGTQTCSGGAWGECTGAVHPTPETCADTSDGVDDDCNGVVDDISGNGEPCIDEEVMGACQRGVLSCEGGAQVCVTGEPMPNEVACDGRDDDCDGIIDEDFNLGANPENCGACGNRCGDGFECCGGACVDPGSDAANCGGCGMACPEGQGCCDLGCLDLMNDRTNCGACGNICPGDQSCCGGSCVDTRSDAANCDACGTACEDGQACCDGSCAPPGSTTCTDCAQDCTGDAGTCCAPSCVDTDTDPANCMTCGNTCEVGESCCGAAGCVDTTQSATNCGACGLECDTPMAPDCCGSGCVDRQTDPRNCGTCGNSCGAGELCCAGACVNPATSDETCGACDNDCTILGEACSNGACCAGGRTSCGDPATCVDTMVDPLNCGTCGNACDAGRLCCGGSCVNPTNDEANCGMCGRTCAGPTGTCCDSNCVNTTNNPSHCGTCGNACTVLFPNCSMSSCGL